MKKSMWIWGALLAAALPAGAARAETVEFDEAFCRRQPSTCVAIVDTVKTIPLAYEADNSFEARLLMSDLVWFENRLRWREGSIFFVSRQQVPGINVDVQAILAKHEEGEKTIFMFSIRGSESQVDWINNLRFRLIPFLEADEDSRDSKDRESVPKVHKGFLRYARELFRSWRVGVLLDEAIELEERGEP